MDNNWDEQIKWGLTAFLTLSAAAFVGWIFMNMGLVSVFFDGLLGIFAPIIYGLILTYFMSGFYNRVYDLSKKLFYRLFTKKIHCHRISKLIASFSCLLFLSLFVWGVISLIAPEVYSSLKTLIQTLPLATENTYRMLESLLKDRPEMRTIFENIYQNIQNAGEDYLNNTLLPDLQGIAAGLGSGILSFIMLLKNLFIGVIVMTYLLNSKDLAKPSAKRLMYAFLPEKIASGIIQAVKECDRVFGSFIVGKLLDSLIIGLLCFAVLELLTMPYAMLVSVIVGITNIIPFFGPFIGAVPSFFLIFVISPRKSLYFLIFIFILQQFDGNILGPKILGDSTGLSGAWVLLSILIFGGFWGFTGMLIGVPVCALLLDFIEKTARKRLLAKDLPQEKEAELFMSNTEKVRSGYFSRLKDMEKK